MERKEAERKAKTIMRATKGGRKGRKARKKLAKSAVADLIMRMGSTNHPSWYMRLGGNLVNLNYGSKDYLGYHDNIIRGPGGEVVQIRTNTDVVIPLVLTAGSGEATRISAQKIANELRLVSGSNTVYDVDDIIDYILNARSIWAGLISIRRALRTLNVKDPYDMDAWVKYTKMCLGNTNIAGGTEPLATVFRQDAANYVNWLNTMMKAVRYMIPANMDLMSRTSWLFDNIFVDTVGKKFGTKVFVAKNLPLWSHTGSDHTGTPQAFFHGNTNAVSKGALEAMIISFTSNPANIAIAGDMMKAYGMGAFLDLGQVGYEEEPQFIYDEAALHQIQNATPLTVLQPTTTLKYQPGVSDPLVVTPSTTIPTSKLIIQPAYWQSKFVNTDDNHILPGETLSLTRFSVYAVATDDGSGNVASVAVKQCGTEVMIDYEYATDLSDGQVDDGIIAINALLIADLGSAADRQNAISAWTKDGYGPLMSQTAQTGTPGSTTWRCMALFDFENWAVLSLADNQSLHTTAIMSMMTPVASVIMQAVAKL